MQGTRLDVRTHDAEAPTPAKQFRGLLRYTRIAPDFQELRAFVTQSLTKMYERLSRSFADASFYAVPKMFIFGAIATAGFPLYYYVWAYLFPQPYENLSLRLAASAIAAPLLFTNSWPRWTHSFLSAYWHLVLTLCLPYFFTFMMLQNGVNTAWAASTVAAILILFIVVDSVNAVIMAVLGTVAGFATFALVGDQPIPWESYVGLMPVFLFALTTGVFFNLSNEREQRAKSLAARALGGHVAHELGNPLTTISVGAKETKEYVPALVESYRSARRNQLDVPPISENHLEFLTNVGRMTEIEVDYSLMVIDMMLKKAGAKSVGMDELKELSAIQCVQSAVSQYAFKSAEERDCVEITTEADFTVFANDTLFRHIVFNLLKNGLYAIKAARRRKAAAIRVWAIPGQRTNRLHMRDNGIGMSQETVARIFDPFFTTRDNGTGLGLHFCQDVMQRFGGAISCQSSPGHYTELVLSFPAARRTARETSACSQTLSQPRSERLESPQQPDARWCGDTKTSAGDTH